jgi:hypothetical protein
VDVHKLKLTLVAFTCATQNISTIEKASEKFRAFTFNYKDIICKLKSANMLTVVIETKLRTLSRAVIRLPSTNQFRKLWIILMAALSGPSEVSSRVS